jgi:acyl carrier protein
MNEPIYATVREIVADALRVDPAALLPGTRLREELGADSMHLVTILIGLDAAFDVEFEATALPKTEVTMAWIVEHVDIVLSRRSKLAPRPAVEESMSPVSGQ